MTRNDLVIRVAGEAGEGIVSTGLLLTQAALRGGFHVLTYSQPPSEIKGGHAFYQIRLSADRSYSKGDSVDILLAFNQEAYDVHREPRTTAYSCMTHPRFHRLPTATSCRWSFP